MTDNATCANCGAVRTGPFCSQCGQGARELNRPIWWIIGEFLDAVFSYDSRTFRTLWLLAVAPGEFTRRYMAGKRASLLPPFRLFVIATALFFIVLQWSGVSLIVFHPPATTGESMDGVGIEFLVPAGAGSVAPLTEEQKKAIADVRRSIETGKAVEAEDAASQKESIAFVKRLWTGIERLLEDPQRINEPLSVWLPRLMLVLVPLLALILAAMHWWPRVYLIEHLVFSVHLHTLMFLLFTLATLGVAAGGWFDIGWVTLPFLAVYSLVAMKRVYRRSWVLTLFKLFWLLLAYFMVLVIGMVLVLLAVLQDI
jgi:hypothetical protein